MNEETKTSPDLTIFDNSTIANKSSVYMIKPTKEQLEVMKKIADEINMPNSVDD